MSNNFFSNISLEVNFPVYFNIIETKEEYENITLSVNKHRYIDRAGFPPKDIFLTIPEKFGEREFGSKKLNQELKEILIHLETKIDVLIKLLAFKQEDIKNNFAFEGTCTKLSCHELTMNIPQQNLKDGAMVHLFLEPPVFPPVYIDVSGKVSKDNELYQVVFEGLNDDDQEEILKYLIKREREILRSNKR